MMIKTPVKRHQMFTSSFVDKYGCFLDDAQINDAQKRINMHDELVENLKISVGYIKEIYSLNGIEPPKSAINRFESLLERCK